MGEELKRLMMVLISNFVVGSRLSGMQRSTQRNGCQLGTISVNVTVPGHWLSRVALILNFTHAKFKVGKPGVTTSRKRISLRSQRSRVR
jgi:hypothetical protein